MDQRISVITLGTRNLAQSRGFYERMGWRRSMKAAEGVAFFQAGGMVLSLYPREELAKDAGCDAGCDADGGGFPGFALAYNARTRDEVDAVLAKAVAAGGRLVKAAAEAFWGGYSGYFSDPDGFLWEVAWNPSWPMGADGQVQLPE